MYSTNLLTNEHRVCLDQNFQQTIANFQSSTNQFVPNQDQEM